MKKYFIFAAIATAGLFASCSSSDDITSNDVQGSIETPEAREAIRLNLATPTAMITRGTGTVGGVGVDNDADTHHSANVWSGQSINVFMFSKSTETAAAVPYANVDEYNADHDPDITADDFAQLTDAEKIKTPATTAGATTLNLTPAHEPGATSTTYLYDNTEMITPGSAENKIPNENTDTDGSGEAMIKDGTIQYYPPQGNFDFFGYHGDDAVANNATIAKTDALWTVPFKIDGTQDLMSTKAELTAAQVAIMGADEAANARYQDYFSAYAARKNVHPTLTFKHLLTRLQFSIIAGNDAAAGWIPETSAGTYTQAEADEANAQLTDALGANETVWTFEAGAPSGQQAWPVNTTGFVKKIKEQDENTTTYTIVQCIKNTTGNQLANDPFLNAYFALPATDLTALDFTQDVPLYEVTKNGDTYTIANAAMAGVVLKNVVASTPAAYNETLDGAIHAGGAKPATAAHQDAERAVKVTSIQVLSENTMGDLAVAWTAANLTDPEKISWDAYQQPSDDITAAENRWLTLMERPSVMYNRNDGATITYADIDAYKNEDYDNLNESTTPKKSVVDAAVAAAGARITAAVYETLTQAGKDKYTIDNTTTANDKLVDLTATAPDIDGTKADKAAGRYPATRVGESIILSPGQYNADGVAQINNANTSALRMKVTLAQKVPTNWNDPDNLTLKTQEYYLDIPAPYLSGNSGDKGFKQNTSYNVKLTVYGLERIVVMTVVEPWVDGGNIEVGADE